MPAQPGEMPFYDLANPLFAAVPARLDTGTIDIPGRGRFAVLTIRTASTTMSVVLGKNDLRTWSGVIADLTGRMSGLARPSAAETAVILSGDDGNGMPQR